MASTEPLPSKMLLNHCAKTWGLSNMAFVRKMENIVYSCDSSFGPVYLRLTTPMRRTRAQIQAEIDWIEHLAKWGLKVPKIIQNLAGNKMTSFSEGNLHYEGVVFSALKGEHPSKETVREAGFLRNLGRIIAQMHLASQNYGRSPEIQREEWFEERGLRHACAVAKQSKEVGLRDQLDKCIVWAQSLSRENYGLIHADLGALNLFVEEDDSIGIIDFDDSCYHWFAFDLAIVIFSMANRFDYRMPQPEEGEWLHHLIEGYRSIRPLVQEEIDWIPRFIHLACLRLFFWIEHHQLLNTFHEDSLEKVVHVKQWTKERIQNFSS